MTKAVKGMKTFFYGSSLKELGLPRLAKRGQRNDKITLYKFICGVNIKEEECLV